MEVKLFMQGTNEKMEDFESRINAHLATIGGNAKETYLAVGMRHKVDPLLAVMVRLK